MYAIIDLETTGGKPTEDRITEIAVVLHDGERIVETFSTLVNPERAIPYYITQLTGISDEMVRDAPRFHEVARKVVELTEGRVFVAHNVRFDYSFLKAAFNNLGYNYQRKTLCTVRLSRSLIPGQPSYSLGKLCKNLDIKIKARHRALGDAEATGHLFTRLMNANSAKVEQNVVSEEIKAQTLPPGVKKEAVMALPETIGVYYFYDEAGHLLYVGKSRNIRKRIVQHFAVDYKSPKSIEFKNRIADITYHETGSELVALLLESDEIKRRKPPYNSAQKRTGGYVGIYGGTDPAGYLTLTAGRLNRNEEPLIILESTLKARNFLYRKIAQFRLCQKYCGLHNLKGPCFDYHLRQCDGSCAGHESPESYNERVQQAIDSFCFKKESFFIIGPGRKAEERSVVCIENGMYRGFGYLEESSQLADGDLRGCIQAYDHNRDIQKIICGYLRQNPHDKIVPYASQWSEPGLADVKN